MNRNDFLNMLGSRGKVSRSMLGEVYELVDLFPYFQSAHLLLLKGLRDNDDVKFERQLKGSALHVADREVLYYLLKNENSAISDEVKTDTGSESASINVSSPETQQTVIETAKNSELLISEIELNNEDQKEENQDQPDTLPPVHSVLMPASSDNEDSERVVLLIDENGQPEDDKIFYMDPGFSISENDDLLELETEDADAEQVIHEKDTGKEIEGDDKKIFKKHLQAELIDRFIITNPRIEPVRDKTILPVEDLSKPHAEEKEGFITETLARIYTNQGYYSKAIEIYEKLSLKFPEKSSYFAAQIEKVKENIKK